MAGMAVHKAMWVGRARTLAFWLLALLVVASIGVLLGAKPAYATTFTVNSTLDGNDLDFPGGTFDGSSDGTCDSNFTVTITCTLRAAIQEANATSGADTIELRIPSSDGNCNATTDVCTISPTSRLPNITDTVTINGYTQSGAAVNTATTNVNNAVLKIELSGAGAGGTADGLTVDGPDAGGTMIKGLVINRFGEDGVVVFDGANAVIEGNFIGTNAAGNAAGPGNGTGVRVVSSGNLIGGPANAAQNVISGNGGGVFVGGSSATGNTISNNHIGTDADAEADLGNSLDGVRVSSAPGVTIGGSSEDGTLNISSGNNGNGVQITGTGSSGTKVLGNLIGLDRNGSGSSNIGNTRDGVLVSSAPQVEVGGTGSTFSNGQGNTISDNGQHGVEIVGQSSTNNKVLGNHIGTDFNGGSDFGNTQDGVRIGNAGNTTVGGTSAGARNVISGNDDNGVFISGTDSATFNKVQGNFIGTDALGAASLGNNLGNAEVGVRVETPGNFVGGTTTGARNVISGNDGTGVSILATGVSSATNNKIEGNFIGPDVNGDLTVGGNFHGVFISGAPGNTVGGTTDGARNVISGNQEDGVFITGASATGNRILRNSIFENGGLGIDLLGNDGVTANDPGDGDTGANNLQNFPVLTSAASNATSTTFQGTLNSTPNTTFGIEFFSNPDPACDGTGHGEGQTFRGSLSGVTTNASGNASFSFTTSTVLAGHIATATATNNNNDTSEFSQCRRVVDRGEPPVANNDSYNVNEDQTLTIPDGSTDVLSNDTDAFGDPLTATRVSGPANGTLNLNPNGSFTYRPRANFFGTDSFTYRASDGASDSNTATVTITVRPVNDRPTITPLSPRPNSTTRDSTPTIRAVVRDIETNLAKANIKLFVDGKRKTTFTYNRTTDQLSFISGQLSFARHTVRIVATDAQRLPASRSWSFRVVRR